MAVSTGFDYGVRKGLVDKGVNYSDIGYDTNTGYVTVKGQNFMKPQKVYNGTSFTTQQDFNNNWDMYNKKIAAANAANAAGAMAGAVVGANNGSTGSSTPNTTTQPAPSKNPADDQYNQLYTALLNAIQNPTPVNADSIYASPQYAAYQAQAQKGADQAVRAAQEAYGSANMGRSYALGERAQGIQNDANAYLNTQVIPQLMAQAQAEKQAQLQNQFSLLNAAYGQQQLGDTREQNKISNSFREGELTGSYLSPEASSLIDQILQQKTNYGAATTDEQRNQARTTADALRNQLSSLGYDASLVGADQTLQQATGNKSKVGKQTIQSQQLDRAAFESDRTYEFAKAQQDWENNFKSAQFDWQKAQQAWENAFQEKNFKQSVEQFAQQMGYNWASLSVRQQESIADMAFKEKQFEFQQQQYSDQNDQLRFERGMDLYKNTGTMPTYMSQYGIDVTGMNDPVVNQDLAAMYSQISSGAKPEDLIKTIDQKISIGLEKSEDGEKLKQAIYKLYPNLDPNQKKSSEGFKLNMKPGPGIDETAKFIGLDKFAKWWTDLFK